MHTPDVILKLSNLLDYILYQVDKPRVSLEEEILHIREYVDLERIRFADTLQVEFKEGEIGKDVEVAPMLLIPLVENAFKHGSILDGTLRVRMEISQNGHSLRFSIGNTCRQEENGSGEKQGIGLENFRKRLDLNYKGNYSLENTFRENWYRAELLIHDLHMQEDET
jgi:LytS/YehU family sensor histidine kinase